MQDRTPLYPGRVKLVPVADQENVYDMTREDSPTQPGTPLSKATFLKDATAALFGLSSDAVPDDVLAKIFETTSGHTETLSALKPWTFINSVTKNVGTSPTEFTEFRYSAVPSNISVFEAFRIDIKANVDALELKSLSCGVSSNACKIFTQTTPSYYLNFDNFPDRTISFVVTPLGYDTGGNATNIAYQAIADPMASMLKTDSLIQQYPNRNPPYLYFSISAAVFKDSGSCTVSLYGR